MKKGSVPEKWLELRRSAMRRSRRVRFTGRGPERRLWERERVRRRLRKIREGVFFGFASFVGFANLLVVLIC